MNDQLKSGILIIIVLISFLGFMSIINSSNEPIIGYVHDSSDFTQEDIELFFSNLRGGGLDKDDIPAIDIPHFVSAIEAEQFLENWDIIIGVNYNGKVVAYPQKILVWHEIVNDLYGEERISITYCPLTASAIAFKGEVADDVFSTLGVSGKLLNSNLVIYDRETDSLWPQLLGRSITGEKLGIKLEKIQVSWTKWENWKSVYPETKVLSKKTGYIRNYDHDPYGSYDPDFRETYYQIGLPLGSVMNKSDVLDYKEMIVGIDYNGNQISIQKSYLEKNKVANFQIIDNESISVFYDENLDSALAYSGNVNGINLYFVNDNGEFFDQFGKKWNIDGTSEFYVESMDPIVSIESFWFAWYAYYPYTTLFHFVD